MFDLRELAQFNAFAAKQFSKAADAINIRMGQINPFRLVLSRRDAAKADADKFTSLLGGEKPRLDGIECLHADKSVLGLRANVITKRIRISLIWQEDNDLKGKSILNNVNKNIISVIRTSIRY